MKRIVIVEDHLLLAHTLRANLAAEQMDAVVVSPDSLESILAQVLLLTPDVVLLDLDLHECGDATPLISPISAAGIRVLVVSGTTSRPRVAQALSAGAFGYCAKSVGFEQLVSKISATVQASSPLDTELRRELADELRHRNTNVRRFEALTERERATLLALASGLSVRDIAREWVLTEATVRSHVRALLTKLEVSSQLAAVAAALSAGWLPLAS